MISPINCDPGKTKLDDSSYTAKTAEKWATRAKTHERWRADNPLQSDESTQPSVKSTQRPAQRWQKVQIHLPKKGLTRMWRGKKTPEESNTINPLLFRKLSPTKMFFLSSVFLFFVIRFSSTETCTKNVQHEAKKAIHNHRRKGREKILRTASEQEKPWGLNLFSFCNLKEKKRSFRCSLCL